MGSPIFGYITPSSCLLGVLNSGGSLWRNTLAHPPFPLPAFQKLMPFLQNNCKKPLFRDHFIEVLKYLINKEVGEE